MKIMSSVFGNNLKVSIFGQSHSEGIGVVVDGFPAGFEIDMEELQDFLNRRAPGRSGNSTGRKERDKPEFLSGLVDGITCGAPLSAVIKNQDARPNDYKEIEEVPRPGHGDLTARIKYAGAEDYRRGGHFSGRLTAPLCIAGGIAMQMLREEGIEIKTEIVELGGVKLKGSPEARQKKIDEIIASVKEEGDSVGGIVQCVISGVPAGLGDPMFDGVENRISQAVFGIPAIKGIEFGAGFGAARMKGSQNNDEYFLNEEGSPLDARLDSWITTGSNNAGGILGGITNGQDIVFRVAVKPTPSISKEQHSINYNTGEEVLLKVKGRHDPSIVPRILPCVEAASAIVILDYML